MPTSKELLTFSKVLDNISEALTELDGETIADIYNLVCSKKIKSKEDSVWEYSGDDDNDS